MTEIYKSRLFHRSLMIHHVRRQHGIDYSNTFRLIQQFSLHRSFRHFATLFFSKDQNLILDGRFQLSKRYNCFRRKRCFFRCFSDHENFRNGFVRDSIDGMFPTYPSDGLSSDGDSILDNSGSFALFLDTFPQTIKQNVNGVISKVDDVPLPTADPSNETINSTPLNVSPGDKLERKKKRIYLSQTKISLQKRWERILQKEKERHRHRKRIGSKTKHFRRAKPSAETQWDEAFRRNGYCIIPRSCEEKRNAEPAFDKFEIVSYLSEIDERNESLHGIHLSPIFRLQVNQQQSFIDFETPSSIGRKEDKDDSINHMEVQRVVFNSAIIDEKEVDKTDAHNKAIFESISLLIAMTREDWQKYDASVHLSLERKIMGNKNVVENSDFHIEKHAEQESVSDATNLNQIHNNRMKTRHFLRHVMEHKYVLTTSLVNLLLAHLVTSTEIENQEIGECCLQIFEEMKILAESGQYECKPDSTTYRILILAFSRRFQGMGEAVKLSQEMVENSSIDINPELFNEALKVCREKTELTIARLLMNAALINHKIRINGASCIIYTEMLRTRKLDREAIDLFKDIQKANLLTQGDEDEYLMAICRWPQRSRRGDVLDLSSFWTDIRYILLQKTQSPKQPDIRVWVTFLEGLYDSAKNDDRLWQMAASATRTVLDTYPRSFVGRKLTTIGLDASLNIKDTELISSILKRLANEPITSNNSKFMANESIMRPPKVPFRALKNSLETCLEISDAKSAKSILESLNQIGDPYPVGAKSELYSLVLKCHAKVNDTENAKRDLQMMIENNMKPSEELYSEVLRTMAAQGRYVEMEELFQSMEMEDGIKPGISSYDAILFARIEEKSWDGVFSLYDRMKAKGIKPSSYTVKGLIVATDQKGGRESVLTVLESLLLCNAQFDESAFRLASKTLFKGVDKNLDKFRQRIREIGKRDQNLRAASLDLVRSIRFAEIENSRPKIEHESKYETKHSGEHAWRLAMSSLLVFAQTSLDNKHDRIEF